MGFSESRDLNSLPSIPEFYKGKSILITGGTGFMGQTLVEKLLYSCTDLDKIYLIIRPKKGVSSKDRLKALYNETKCFERLREEKPGVFESKVIAIDGDTSESGFALSDEDKQVLINNVNVFFNGAASVRFDDSLHVAAKLNLKSTYIAIELAKQMKKLCAFIHISTAYSNCDRFYVEETLYPARADWKDTLAVCENLDKETLKALTHKYLGKAPNTYIFTKQLAETLVADQKGVLPAIVIRPSIVIAAHKEPFIGWVNNFNGPNGIITACGKGIMRSIYAKPDVNPDMIPVDHAIRHFIVAAWTRGVTDLKPTDEVEIYNCTSNGLWDVSWETMVRWGSDAVGAYPMDGILWNPHFSITHSAFYHYLKVLCLQVGQAIIIDTLLWLMGKKPMLMKIQRKIFAANIALQYFMTNEWTFNNKKFLALRSHIKEQDREYFDYDLESVKPKEFYLEAAISGIDHFLKAATKDLKERKAYFFKLRVLDYILTTLVCGYILWIIIKSSFFKSLTSGVLQFFDI